MSNFNSGGRALKKTNLKSEGRSKKLNQTIFLVAMMALPVLQWLVFWLYVNVSSFVLAFQDKRTEAWTTVNFIQFWESLTSPYGEIKIALKNTIIYFCTSLIVILPLSFFITYFLYKRIRLYKAFRVIFYLPAIISSVAMVTTYSNFISPNGPLGVIIDSLGGFIPPEGYLGRAGTATAAIVIYCIWTGFGTNIILFSGAMTRIPMEIVESERMEGCGPMRELFNIVLPLIWPTISTQIIFICTGVFNASGPILLFTNGAYETTTLSFWIFQQVYGNGVFGGSGSYNLVSAAGLCFTFVGVPIILFVRWLMERIPAVEY